MIILVDNYDSFTYNLMDYFLQIGMDCRVIKNDEYSPEEVAAMKPKALVFSPGPEVPAKAGYMMQMIEYFHLHLPLLGICLGHQGIGEFFGAQLVKAGRPMHGKTSVVAHDGNPVFKDIPPRFRVMRYHSLVLQDIASTPLKVIAQAQDGEAMAIAHPQLPVYGFQFHPEAILTEYGMQLLKNWAALNNLLS